MADDSGNGAATIPVKMPGGITGKGFRPGQSGNPKGPTKGLVRLVKELTEDGDQIAQFYWAIFQGKPLGFRRVEQTVTKPDGTTEKRVLKLPVVPGLDHRIEAASWLADRGWGKPRQTHELVAKRVTIFRQSDGRELAPAPADSAPDNP